MTKEQIKHLKSVFAFNKDGQPLAFNTTAIANDHNALSNRKDFVIWDDDNELMYGVKINEDQETQTIAPVKITACSYEILFFLDSIYTTDNFEVAVDKLFTFLSDDMKDALKTWAKNLPIQGNKVERTVPYYMKDPRIIQDLNLVDMRTEKERNTYPSYDKKPNTNP